MDAIAKRQAARIRFLRALYESAEGEQLPLDEPIIVEAARLSPNEGSAAAEYVQAKRLIRFVGGSGRHRGLYALTTSGVDEIERAHAHPEKPTEHLPPWRVVFNIGTMTTPKSKLRRTEARNRRRYRRRPSAMLVNSSSRSGMHCVTRTFPRLCERRSRLTYWPWMLSSRHQSQRRRFSLLHSCRSRQS